MSLQPYRLLFRVYRFNKFFSLPLPHFLSRSTAKHNVPCLRAHHRPCSLPGATVSIPRVSVQPMWTPGLLSITPKHQFQPAVIATVEVSAKSDTPMQKQRWNSSPNFASSKARLVIKNHPTGQFSTRTIPTFRSCPASQSKTRSFHSHPRRSGSRRLHTLRSRLRMI